MVHVRTACGLDGETNAIRQSGRRHELTVGRGIGAPLPVPVEQMRQLHAQHRRLQRIEPEIAADRMMHVFRLRAVIAQETHTHARSELLVCIGFQLLDFRSQNELLRIADACHRGQDVLANRRVLKPEIE